MTDICLPFGEDFPEPKSSSPLIEKFVIPPFSVFDSKQGYWIDRRRRWLELGIESEIGRKDGLTYRPLDPEKYKNVRSLNDRTTSVFDPVLCEVILQWFSREGSLILDPFAGGSVRGVVASQLGRKYLGVELRKEQVEANERQMSSIGGDAQWICGDSLKVVPDLAIETDFLFSCPPYADLEIYSDDPDDLSNMPYDQFLQAYRSIIRESCAKLRPHRFACFVVSEVRDKKTGIYRGFISDTIRAFEESGLGLYNDVVLLNQVGTAAIRANLSMETRKIVRIHQNVLVFVKGDPKKAANWVKDEDQQLDLLSA